MNDLLVDEVSDHLEGAEVRLLVPVPVRSLKVEDHSMNQDLDHIWELSVDHSNHSGEDMSEVLGGRLGFEDASGKEAPSSNEVVVEELEDDSVDVVNVDFVNYTIDALPQVLPLQLLVLLGSLLLLLNLLEHLPHLERRNIGTTSCLRHHSVPLYFDLYWLLFFDLFCRAVSGATRRFFWFMMS